MVEGYFGCRKPEIDEGRGAVVEGFSYMNAGIPSRQISNGGHGVPPTTTIRALEPTRSFRQEIQQTVRPNSISTIRGIRHPMSEEQYAFTCQRQ